MNATRPTKGAGHEKRACHMCHAQVYFARDGSEEICRDWKTGTPHDQTCAELEKPQPPTSVHRDSKPEKVADAPAKLITFHGSDRIVIRPRAGGALEITRTEAGCSLRMARTPGSTGLVVDEDEVDLLVASTFLRKLAVDPAEVGAATEEKAE